MGLLAGEVSCLLLMLVFVARINWDDEADKAQTLNFYEQQVVNEDSEERTWKH